MNVVKERVDLKEGLTKIQNHQWRLMVIWTSLHENDDDIEIVEGHLLQRRLHVGVVFQEASQLVKTIEIVAPLQDNLKHKIRFVITGNASHGNLDKEVMQVLGAIQTQTLLNDTQVMVYIKGMKDVDSLNHLKSYIQSYLKKQVILNLDRNVLVGFCEGATLIVIGKSSDNSLDDFFCFMGVSVIMHNTYQQSIPFLEQNLDLKRHPNIFRVLLLHQEDIVETVSALRHHWGSVVPILVYFEGKLELMDTSVYDFGRIKVTNEKSEVLQFGFMRNLTWAPPINRSMAELLLDINMQRKYPLTSNGDGELVITKISCWDLYPKDSNGLSDPYVELIREETKEKWKTPVIKKTRFPEWSIVDWTIPCFVHDQFKINVWDWDIAGGHDFEGLCCMDIKNLLSEISVDTASLEKTWSLKPKSFLKKEKLEHNDSRKLEHDPKKSEYDSKKSEHDSKKSEHDSKKSEHDSKKSEHDSKKSEHDPKKSEHDSKKSEHDSKKSEHDPKKSEHDPKKLAHDPKKSDLSAIIQKLELTKIEDMKKLIKLQIPLSPRMTESREQSPRISGDHSPRGKGSVPDCSNAYQIPRKSFSAVEGVVEKEPRNESSSPRHLKRSQSGQRSEVQRKFPKQSNYKDKKKVSLAERQSKDSISGTITFFLSWRLTGHVADNEADKFKKHFGKPLKVSLNTAKEDGQEHVAIKICQYLSQKGTNQQGIFRIPGVASTTHYMKDIIDRGEHISLQEYRILDIAALLKLYFRELPESLLPKGMYHYILNFNLNATTEDELWANVGIIQRIMNMLDVELRVIWKSLIWALMDIAENSEVNKMNAQNLATCLAPTVMIAQEVDSDPQKFLEATKYAVATMQFMIEWGYDCFDFDKKEKIWDD